MTRTLTHPHLRARRQYGLNWLLVVLAGGHVAAASYRCEGALRVLLGRRQQVGGNRAARVAAAASSSDQGRSGRPRDRVSRPFVVSNCVACSYVTLRHLMYLNSDECLNTLTPVSY